MKNESFVLGDERSSQVLRGRVLHLFPHAFFLLLPDIKSIQVYMSCLGANLQTADDYRVTPLLKTPSAALLCQQAQQTLICLLQLEPGR